MRRMAHIKKALKHMANVITATMWALLCCHALHFVPTSPHDVMLLDCILRMKFSSLSCCSQLPVFITLFFLTVFGSWSVVQYTSEKEWQELTVDLLRPLLLKPDLIRRINAYACWTKFVLGNTNRETDFHHRHRHTFLGLSFFFFNFFLMQCEEKRTKTDLLFLYFGMFHL